MPTIREALQEDWPRVRDFYQRTRYSSPIETSDRVLIAEMHDGIVGAVRLCTEGGVQVLRGMRVLEGMRRQHIGTALLHASEDILGGAPCYCIPYDYLENFYGKAGFKKVPLQDVPPFIRERLHEYERRGLKVIIMKLLNRK